MKSLKNKIISFIKKEVKVETGRHIEKIKEELNDLIEKDRSRKFNPFNFIKINYLNFKDGYSSFFDFVMKTMFDIMVTSMAVVPTFLIFFSIISDKTIIQMHYEVILTSYLMFFISFIFDVFPSKIPEIKNQITELKNKIDNTELRLKSANSKIEKIFENEEDINQFFRVDNHDKNEISIFNRPIDIEILKETGEELTKNQIIRLLEKSGKDIINCNDLIELIRELENKDKAIKNYNKLFSFSNKKTQTNKKSSYA